MARILLILLSLSIAGPATAHSLRVFARVEGTQVSGYAFFIGGGRPAGATWVARMADAILATGKTDGNGAYSFAAPSTVISTIAITVDTGEGHIATTTLVPARFGPMAEGKPDDAPAPTLDTNPAPAAGATAQQIEAAVERQVAPLLERIETMDARMRFTDVMSGVFLILGLAGMALWARGRRS